MGDSACQALADRAGARRCVALGVIASCARFAPARRAGLGPDYRRGPVWAGELLAARRRRHVALAYPEFRQQVTGLIELAERLGIPLERAVAQDEVRAKVGQVRERALPPLRALVRKKRGPAAQVRSAPKHVGVREAHASLLVRHEEPVVVRLFRQPDAWVLE